MKIDVIVEVPRGSRNKYEWDEKRHVMRLDRCIPGAVVFPADYGFIPGTCGVDGDPVDALVLLQEPTFPGVWVKVRPIGVCWVDAGKYREPKLITVAVHDPRFSSLRDIDQVSSTVLDEIQQFFDVYKDFDDGHDARADGFDGRGVARHVVREASRAAKSLVGPS